MFVSGSLINGNLCRTSLFNFFFGVTFSCKNAEWMQFARFWESVGCLVRSWKLESLNLNLKGRPKFFSYMTSSNQTPLVMPPNNELVVATKGTLEWVLSVASQVIGDLEVDEPLTTATRLNFWLHSPKTKSSHLAGGRAPNGNSSEPTPALQELC